MSTSVTAFKHDGPKKQICQNGRVSTYPNVQRGFANQPKHGLSTFVHERLRYMLLDPSSSKSEIELLCLNVNDYKIVNVYKSPSTRLLSPGSPSFPSPAFMLVILTVVALIGITITTVRKMISYLAGQVLIVLSSCIMPKTPPAITPAVRTLALIEI